MVAISPVSTDEFRLTLVNLEATPSSEEVLFGRPEYRAPIPNDESDIVNRIPHDRGALQSFDYVTTVVDVAEEAREHFEEMSPDAVLRLRFSRYLEDSQSAAAYHAKHGTLEGFTFHRSNEEIDAYIEDRRDDDPRMHTLLVRKGLLEEYIDWVKRTDDDEFVEKRYKDLVDRGDEIGTRPSSISEKIRTTGRRSPCYFACGATNATKRPPRCGRSPKSADRTSSARSPSNWGTRSMRWFAGLPPGCSATSAVRTPATRSRPPPKTTPTAASGRQPGTRSTGLDREPATLAEDCPTSKVVDLIDE